MSDRPCLGCRSVDHGRLFYSYCQTYVGDEMLRWRTRLCATCAAELLAPVLASSDLAVKENEWITPDERAGEDPLTVVSKYRSVSAAPRAASRSTRTSAP